MLIVFGVTQVQFCGTKPDALLFLSSVHFASLKTVLVQKS